MSILILDHDLQREIRANRRDTGADRWDEVWNGVYIVMPLPDDLHQEIVTGFIYILHTCLRESAKIRPGVNISDRTDNWKKNYRGPDVVVFLEGTTAQNRGSYWFGGPDFAVEVVSKGDRSRKKLDFYASVNVLELMLVFRDPWAIELYRLREGHLKLSGRSTIEAPDILPSEVLPLSFSVSAGIDRPKIDVARLDGEGRWSI